THPAEDTNDTKNEKYTELKKEAFNMNPFDTIFWDYTKKCVRKSTHYTIRYRFKPEYHDFEFSYVV
ncbi:hypothetical protein OJ929_10645, partial [Streptococcus anginosus]|nr:hypothetical protein [Streptococcus anginosus]